MKHWQSCSKVILDFDNPTLIFPDKCPYCNRKINKNIIGTRQGAHCENCGYEIWCGSKIPTKLYFYGWTVWYEKNELRIDMNFDLCQYRVIQTDPSIDISKLLNYIELHQQIIRNHR